VFTHYIRIIHNDIFINTRQQGVANPESWLAESLSHIAMNHESTIRNTAKGKAIPVTDREVS
jgi:hypothetical protein